MESASPTAATLPDLPELAGRRLLMVAPTISTHTHRWARYFVERGMEVSILSPFDEPVEGARVFCFPPRRAWYHRIKGLHLRIDYHLHWKRILRQCAADIVHVHYPDGGSRNRFYYRGVSNLVVSTWGSEVVESAEFPLSEKHKAGVRAALAQARVVTATTRFLAEETAPYCAAGTPIHIIPFGVDAEVFRPERRGGGDACRIGFVKNLEPKYGPEVLVEAFAAIAAAVPGVQLVMCGRGPMEMELRARVQALGLAGQVEFAGRVPHAQVPALLNSLDLAVMPSRCRESFGVSAVEASACGVPVVASRVGGVPEAVADGETGVLVPPGDVAALADACIALLRDPGRRRTLGEAGRRFVLDRYQWSQNAAVMESIYRQVLAGRAVETDNVLVAGERHNQR